MKKVTRHFSHYFPLIGIFAAGFLGFALFSYDKQFQAGVAIAVAIAYVTWGLVHHYIHKELSTEVVFEYVAIASIGLAVILSIILRS